MKKKATKAKAKSIETPAAEPVPAVLTISQRTGFQPASSVNVANQEVVSIYVYNTETQLRKAVEDARNARTELSKQITALTAENTKLAQEETAKYANIAIGKVRPGLLKIISIPNDKDLNMTAQLRALPLAAGDKVTTYKVAVTYTAPNCNGIFDTDVTFKYPVKVQENQHKIQELSAEICKIDDDTLELKRRLSNLGSIEREAKAALATIILESSEDGREMLAALESRMNVRGSSLGGTGLKTLKLGNG